MRISHDENPNITILGQWHDLSSIPENVPILITNGVNMYLAVYSPKSKFSNKDGFLPYPGGYHLHYDWKITHWSRLPKMPMVKERELCL